MIFKLNENLDKEYENWVEVKSKQVPDYDGFLTDYTWYKGVSEDGDEIHIFMFGDKDVYEPDRDYADWECETQEQAEEWFDNYKGFEEEDRYSDELVEEYEDEEGYTHSENLEEALDALYAEMEKLGKNFDNINRRTADYSLDRLDHVTGMLEEVNSELAAIISDSKKSVFKESVLNTNEVVKDSYNHFVNDLGRIPSVDDILNDITDNYDGYADIQDTQESTNRWYSAISQELNRQALEVLNEGISKDMPAEEIAKKHRVPLKDIEDQLVKGIKIEKEHTDDGEKATRIALDHLFEMPDYYTRLDKMEKSAKVNESLNGYYKFDLTIRDEDGNTYTQTEYIPSGEYEDMTEDEFSEYFQDAFSGRVVDIGPGEYVDSINESLNEDTVKQGNSWVNKGKEGTHGKFRTKKAADAQRRAIWVNWDK